MGFALTPGEAPLHFSRSKNVMHVVPNINIPPFCIMNTCACERASGQVSERPKETVLKTVEGQPSASSNLALSANRGLGNMPRPFFFFWNLSS